MKIRICPDCGKQNPENSFNCSDCGQTLSVDTLFDLQEQHSVADFRAQRMLANISPYFAEEVDAVLEAAGENRRDVLFGANVAPLSKKSYFWFGFLIITSQRLLCVQFQSETKRDIGATFFSLRKDVPFFLVDQLHSLNLTPKRASFQYPIAIVNFPTYSLMPNEISSRRTTILDLYNLVSIGFETFWVPLPPLCPETELTKMTAKFQKDKELRVIFYMSHEAQQAQRILKSYREPVR
jgi:hypothetical protein